MKIIDLHCDTIRRIFCQEKDGRETLKQNHFHVDLKKMIQGDYLLQNFAVFINMEETNRPFEAAMEMIDCYYEELEANTECIAPVFHFHDIIDNQANGKISAMLTLEEGGIIQGKLSFLRDFYRLGVRMMNLTWNYENEIGAPNLILDAKGVPLFQKRNRKGLSEFGKEAIVEMERLGMIIDVSHLSDGGFWDVIDITKKPFAASHSNAAGICDVSRNLSDDMIQALAQRGGIMGLNFCEDFLCLDQSVKSGTILDAMVAHIKHIIKTGGIEVCALGTDFDGIPQNADIKDASMISLLTDCLRKEGVKEGELEKICYSNVLRFYKDTLK